MVLCDQQHARNSRTKRLPEALKTKILCLLLCIITFPQNGHAVSKDYKVVFKEPCSATMELKTAVPNLAAFTVCTYIKLTSSDPWAAFIYKNPKSTPECELGLLGDSNQLVILIFDNQINITQKLNLHSWYAACIQWESKGGSMEFYLDTVLIASQKVSNDKGLTGGGSLSLGCSQSLNVGFSSQIGLVGELYMFRVWKQKLPNIPKCGEGNVIQWKMSEWSYTPSLLQSDTNLPCAKPSSDTTTLAPTVKAAKPSSDTITLALTVKAGALDVFAVVPPISQLSDKETTKLPNSTSDSTNVSANISSFIKGIASSFPDTTPSKTSSIISLTRESTITESNVDVKASTLALTREVTSGHLNPAPTTLNVTTGDLNFTAVTSNITTAVTRNTTIMTSNVITTGNDMNFTTITSNITTTVKGENLDTTLELETAPKMTSAVTGHDLHTTLEFGTASKTSVTGMDFDTTLAIGTAPKTSSAVTETKVDIKRSTTDEAVMISEVTGHDLHTTLEFGTASNTSVTGMDFDTTLAIGTAPKTSSADSSSKVTADLTVTETKVDIKRSTTDEAVMTSEVTENTQNSSSTTSKVAITVTSNVTTAGDHLNSSITTSQITSAGSTTVTNMSTAVTQHLNNTATTSNLTISVTGHDVTTTLATVTVPNASTTECPSGEDCPLSPFCNASAVYAVTFNTSDHVCNNLTGLLKSFNLTEVNGLTPTVSPAMMGNITEEESLVDCIIMMRGKNCTNVLVKITEMVHNILNFTPHIKAEFCCCSEQGICPSDVRIYNTSWYCNTTSISNNCSNTITPGTYVTSSVSSQTSFTSIVTFPARPNSTNSGSGPSYTTKIQPITSQITTTDDDSGAALDKLHDILSSGNLNASVVHDIVSNIENLLSGEVKPKTATKLVGVLNTFLNISQNLITPVSERLIKVVDTVGLKLNFPGKSINITSEFLVLAVNKISPNNFTETSFGVGSSSGLQVSLGSQTPPQGDASVVLPASLLSDLSAVDKEIASRVQFNFFDKTSLFMDSFLNAQKQFLVSKVISSSVSNLSITNLSDNVTVTLPTSFINNQADVLMKCVFWNFTKYSNTSGGWESAGCTVARTSPNATICKCNHLTSFAILMDVSRTPLSPEDTLILTFISYIGCGLSAIFLSVTLVTYIAFEKIRRDYPSKILIQLCAALVCLNLTFLLDPWISLYNHIPGLCISVAAFLHYFLLVSITWMGLEAFHMYFSLVKVFNTYVRKYILKFCIVGWGFPAVVVAIVLAVNKDLYGIQISGKYPNGSSDEFCWIADIVFYITVVGYFCLIFLLNISMFIVVLIQLCRIKKKKQLGYQRKTTFQDMRSVAGITFLLGITWGLAFFSWGPGKVVVVYLFTIFNTLQGFFIFIFYCVAKENVRKQWRRYLCCGKFRLAENSDWSKTATNKLGKQVSNQGISSSSTNSIQSSSNSNSTTLLVANEYSLHPNGNGHFFKERNSVSFMLPNGEVPLQDISEKKNSIANGSLGQGGAQRPSIRRTSNRGSVHFMDPI
ncbi:adhesion G-protein coupled receptor G2 isoform X3 [Bombina bombina]|uniref:adhesion G-protein coupled receptor G2 isoform X3 n=1 Tax=Bombina bombina TaxID=8345 RepID=UPI00235AC8FC|nr:adhesion G-protein coupled receptor G2 isoform X3 [Bombina bombina]